MAKIIAFANQKGGVAKTTSTINVGVGMAKKGFRVLIIDCDPQGSCTAALGIQDADELEVTLTQVIERMINKVEFDPHEAIIHCNEDVDLVPANIELAGAEMTLVQMFERERYIGDYLEMVQDEYDFIFIDCSPNLGQLTINALCCADYVVIPVQAAYLPIKGLEQLLKTIFRINQRLNTKLKILGVVITMVQINTNYAKQIIEVLELSYGDRIRIFDTMIPQNIRASEAPALGISVYEHDKKCAAAIAYEKLTEEVLSYV